MRVSKVNVANSGFTQISNPQISNSYTYNCEPNSTNILATKENKKSLDSTVVSNFSYTMNEIGQRTQVSNFGTAFDSVRDITWGYDSKGQVTKADSTIAGLDRAYQYDMIGNRLKSADSLTLPTTNNYNPNALNQYTAIDSFTPTYDADENMFRKGEW